MKITLLTGRTFDFSADFDFNIKVNHSAKAKKLTLRIDEKNHCPVLTVPKYCSRKQAYNFVKTHQDWIQNTLARLPKQQKFSDKSCVSFFGQQYTIIHTPLLRGTRFEENTLKVGGNIEFLHRRITDFLKEQSLKLLSELTLKKAKELNCKVASVSVKDTKSRWGSCSSLGNINYNWRIALAPYFVIEYLVCHEVSHLKHQNHSADFWNTVQSLHPTFKESRHWLKIKGKELYKYI